MALYPNYYEGKYKLAPGARGEQFVADLPGYRDQAVRINRSNNRFNVRPHNTLSQKYIFDTRLRPLFKYGFAVGYNNMVVTKGRIVAADPHRDAIDWTSDKEFNVLTLANGGAAVKIRGNSDVYPAANVSVSTTNAGQKVFEQGLEWAPLETIATTWATGYYRACQNSGASQLNTAGYTVDVNNTGKIAKNGVVTDDVRPANVPLGMLSRNEYTRFENDSMDGMQPGPVITDAIVELPYYAFKDEAEQNPWGAVYGSLKVGDLVKSDENGRIVVSPLSIDSILESMDAAEIERERQQVVGQVIGLNHDMVPEGGYKWAQWALEDRLKFEGFNPTMYPANNRPGEDSISQSAYQSTGRYPGYPYDQAYTEHDLHMVGNGQRKGNYDKFMQAEYQLDNGIPGLTDGGNVAIKNYENRNAATIFGRKNTNEPYVKQFVKIAQNGNIVDGSLEVQIVQTGTTSTSYTSVSKADDVKNNPKTIGSTPFAVTYYDAVQGMIVIEVTDPATADTLLANDTYSVNLKYKKRGEAGIPTFMDFLGCCGSAHIMLQR